MYKAMRGLAPAYLSELCASYCVEAGTRSSAHGNLVVQQMCICRRRSGGMEPVAMLRSQISFREQFLDGCENIAVHC